MPFADSAALLTAQRTDALFAAMDGGAGSRRRDLQHEITLINLPTARSIAARYHGRGEVDDDLMQVAYLALVKAVQHYDPWLGRDFLSYAVPCIHGEIKRYFRDHGWAIRPPRHVQELRASVNAASQELAQQLGRSATPAEIAVAAELDLDTVQECLASNQLYHLPSIDAPVDGAAGVEHGTRAALFDTLGHDDGRLESVVDLVSLRPLLARLPRRERRLLTLRFVHEWSQARIASELGVSQVQVSRLLSKVLGELREQLQAA